MPVVTIHQCLPTPKRMPIVKKYGSSGYSGVVKYQHNLDSLAQQKGMGVVSFIHHCINFQLIKPCYLTPEMHE